MSDTANISDTAVPEPAVRKAALRRLPVNLAAQFRVHRRVWIALASLVGLCFLAGASTVVISRQPGFCLNCHEIRPAYDQWRTSAHSGVTCVDCHTEPGLTGYIQVNTTGAKNIITHLVAGYRLPEDAAVRDASCLNCHPRESRPEASLRTTLRVAHSKHDKQQCADCHGRLVHLNPAGEVSTTPKPHAVRDCTTCHTPETCPHGDATLSCTSCHSGNIPKHEPAKERGVMPRESCQECHKQNKVGSPEYCQTCHISPHGVSLTCSRCHTSQVTWTEHSFNHPVALVGKHSGLDCTKCHTVKNQGTLKYACSNCHTPPTPHKGSTAECSTCHREEGWTPVKLTNHKFPQDHNGANGACTACHPQGNTAVVNCNTCHPKPTLDAKHAARGLTGIDTMCASCHPTGKKP